MTTTEPHAALPAAAPAPAAAEEWNESDFDFDDARSYGLDALRPPSSVSHVESEGSDAFAQRATGLGIMANKHDDEEEADWDRELANDNNDEDDDQVDTIKVSALAGETLSQLAAAGAAARASAAYTGSVTHFQASGSARAATTMDATEDWDEDLEMPELLSSASLLRRPASFGSVELDFDTPSLDEHSDATSGSAEPARRTRIAGGGVGASTRHHGSSSSSASSLLSPPRLSAKTMGALRNSKNAASLDFARAHAAAVDDEDLESAFDLAPQLERLVLSPAIARQRSHPTLEQQSLLWGEDAAKRSSSPESMGLGNLRRTLRGAPGSSGASVSAPESDADDEEDMLDGLELPEGLFGATTAKESTAAAATAQSSSGSSARRFAPVSALQAMLDARKNGLVPSHSGDLSAPLSPTTSDADFTNGLVITDDLDLSPSRLHAKSLAYKMRPGVGGGAGAQRTRVAVQPQAQRRALTSGVAEGVTPRPRIGTPVTPALTITGSSPQQPSTRTVPHLQSGVRSSPPRAFSSHAHAAGLAPRGSTTAASSGGGLRSVERTLRFKKSVGDLLAAANAGGAGQAGASGSGSAGRARTSLVRKRSLPHLGDSQPPSQQASPLLEQASSSRATPAAAFDAPTQPRLFASTAASRARAAEAQARRLGSPSMGGEAALPPARPCTPTTFAAPAARVGNAGAGRFTMPTTASRARQADAVQTLVTARPSSPLGNAAAARRGDTAVRMLRRPKRGRSYGDGHELESFDDLPTNKEREARTSSGSQAATSAALPPSTPTGARGTAAKDDTLRARGANVLAALTSRWSEVPTAPSAMRKRQAPSTPTSQHGSPGSLVAPSSAPATRRRKRGRNSKDPTLIRNLGGSGAAPRAGVVGDMRWNAARQRWEGNEGVLRDFENALSSSSRPALITPLSASTSGLLPALPSPASTTHAATAKVTGKQTTHTQALASQPGARVVGDMIFDQESMKWVHALGEEEPDPFAEMQEEEEAEELALLGGSSSEDATHEGVGTARKLHSSDLLRVQAALAAQADATGERRARTSSSSAVSSASIEGAMERGAREPPAELGMSGCVSTHLWRATMQAGARHDEEIKAFLPSRPGASVRNPREHLYLLQRIARQAAR